MEKSVEGGLERAAVRAFLDAAGAGDLSAMAAYMRSGGNVNGTLGEGWTALHCAVTRGKFGAVECLLGERATDLNARTAVGTSALAMALRMGNNVMVRLLLDGGASRATIAHDQLQQTWDASWLWPDVQRRLHPGWSIVWTPHYHHRFSRQEREKCRLVVCINHFAAAASASLHAGSGFPRHRAHDGAAQRASEGMRGRVWQLVATLIPMSAAPDNADTGHARHQVAVSEAIRWQYLPPVVLRHVLQYALFLW